jgi:flavorubredoxin
MSQPYATAPYQIAEETFVLPHVVPLGPGINTYLNTMLIRGKEPVVVDTSGAVFRESYLQQLQSLVDLEDVRWIYLSHDDGDHVGNLQQVLEAAPNATLVTTWFMTERLGLEQPLPIERLRWVNDGDSFEVDGRLLHAVRPPIFDSPVTRGLFDSRTGVYWAGDSFGIVSPEPVEDAADVSADAYRDGFLAVASLVSPWHQWLDEQKYLRHVDRVMSLPIQVVASGHGPAIYASIIPTASALLRRVPTMDVYPELTQRDLEAMLSAGLVAA